MSTKGLSPQNSLRSRSNTCSSMQQVSYSCERPLKASMTVSTSPSDSVTKCMNETFCFLVFVGIVAMKSRFRWRGRLL